VIHTCARSLCLQLAVSVHDTDSTDVVALGKEQFQEHFAIGHKPVAVRVDDHALLHGGHTGGEQPVGPFNFDHAEATTASFAQPIEMAECRYLNALFTQHGQQCLSFLGCHCLIIYGECHNCHWGSSIVQTPAAQRCSSMCAIYSS